MGSYNCYCPANYFGDKSRCIPNPHILAIYTGGLDVNPMPYAVFDTKGSDNAQRKLSFESGATALESCSLTFRNEFWIFGGKVNANPRQISKLIGCSFKRIGYLAFNHIVGACTNYQDQKVFLCFNSWAPSPYTDYRN